MSLRTALNKAVKITSLEGAPSHIKGGFPGVTPPGSYNEITSLAAAPKSVGKPVNLSAKR